MYCNKKFVNLFPEKNKEEIISKHAEIIGTNGESISRKLAEKASRSRRVEKQSSGIIMEGNRIAIDVYETPFYVEQNLDKTFSSGCFIDVTELDELQRNLKNYQTAQLEILGSLGTAFAVFDQKMKIDFYNRSFIDLWSLDKNAIDDNFSYPSFLDNIREKRLLQEVPDYKAFKHAEINKFMQIIEPINDLLHLPNGKTLRRIRAPYPMGGVVFAYEDISDRLAATTAYNSLLSVQNEILANLFDAVLVFGSNGRLTFFNDAYVKMWQADQNFLKLEPSFDDVLDSQQSFFDQEEDWSALK